MDVEARLSRLERQVRWWRAAAVAGPVVLLVAATSGHGVTKATSFEVVDDAGVVRGSFTAGKNGAVLALFGEKSTSQLSGDGLGFSVGPPPADLPVTTVQYYGPTGFLLSDAATKESISAATGVDGPVVKLDFPTPTVETTVRLGANSGGASIALDTPAGEAVVGAATGAHLDLGNRDASSKVVPTERFTAGAPSSFLLTDAKGKTLEAVP